ncbi:MAG: DUF4291 domain-containing protein [Planctomycetota bacterium]
MSRARNPRRDRPRGGATRPPERTRAVRADFDRDSVVVYQAFSDPIADAALQADRFVAPYSFGRMTWIKPSFLWLMDRSQWARRAGQTRVLALRISREDWERALARAVLTDPDPSVYADASSWREAFARAEVHVQWDPERSIRGQKLAQRSIQVGIGRALVRELATDWVRELRDLTPLVRRIHEHLTRGDPRRAQRLLPPEREYPLPEAIARRIGAS